jgi:addiction module RelE/StbE family toxin
VSPRPRQLQYSRRYFRRLDEIHERIAEDNPAAAVRMIERIRTAVERLAVAPAMGRPGRVADTRELVITRTPYIVPYRVVDDAVQIITILHSAQLWPTSFP